MQYKFTVEFSYTSGGAKANLEYIMKNYGVPERYLEVGVYEGNTFFWMNEFCNAHGFELTATAVDPHAESHDLTDVKLSDAHELFVHNMSVCSNKNNIEYIREYSGKALVDLVYEQKKFDLVYIDGDHRASGVLSDLVLAWNLIDVGGIILCDDATTWKHIDKNGIAAVQYSPRLAVETFVACNWDKLTPIYVPDGNQTAFRKIA